MVFRHNSQRSYGFIMTKTRVLILNRYQEFVKRPESFRSLMLLSTDKGTPLSEWSKSE